ncbi:hypothetical protein BGZ65_011265, partial [Modicella reniformis]
PEGRRLQANDDNDDDDDKEKEEEEQVEEEYVLPSSSTIDMHIKALVNLYNRQCMDFNNTAMTLETVPMPQHASYRLQKANQQRQVFKSH